MKLKLDISDPKTRMIWESIQANAREVATWPESKRGEDGPRVDTAVETR